MQADKESMPGDDEMEEYSSGEEEKVEKGEKTTKKKIAKRSKEATTPANLSQLEVRVIRGRQTKMQNQIKRLTGGTTGGKNKKGETVSPSRRRIDRALAAIPEESNDDREGKFSPNSIIPRFGTLPPPCHSRT